MTRFARGFVAIAVALSVAACGAISAPKPGCPRVAQAHALPADFDPRLLGEKSVTDVIPGARPGDRLAPTAPLRMWHEATRNIYLGVDPHSGFRDQDVQKVWSAVAAMEREFPALYRFLMTDTRGGSAKLVTRPAGDPWTNTNSVPLFILVSDGFQPPDRQAIASNYYWVGPQRGRTYTNVPFVALSPSVIDGRKAGLGPPAVYGACSLADARAVYLAEGLIDSLLHERIHDFIAQYYAHDRLFRALHPDGPQPRCEYDVEELLVKRFLLRAYEAKPQLFSQAFFDYWRSDTRALAQRVESSPCYRALEAAGQLARPLLELPPRP